MEGTQAAVAKPALPLRKILRFIAAVYPPKRIFEEIYRLLEEMNGREWIRNYLRSFARTHSVPKSGNATRRTNIPAGNPTYK